MLQKGVSGDSEEESDDGGQSDVSLLLLRCSFRASCKLQRSNGLTKLDSELARLRGLLEKKYANDHDAGYTYIDPISLESVPLTPFMMKEWARAMVMSLLILNHSILTHYCSMMDRSPLPIPHPPRHLIRSIASLLFVHTIIPIRLLHLHRPMAYPGT